ncbi:hypothetical protein [Streptomyces diastatochromogenes]|uniref:hypothetical protein n=1 Tax=Streptomyces diastatochromogenes TaxID=42236 RepID=UPI00117C49C5|nr:hypothetical protein [Streptomyces diastatochromogenes]
MSDRGRSVWEEGLWIECDLAVWLCAGQACRSSFVRARAIYRRPDAQAPASRGLKLHQVQPGFPDQLFIAQSHVMPLHHLINLRHPQLLGDEGPLAKPPLELSQMIHTAGDHHSVAVLVRVDRVGERRVPHLPRDSLPRGYTGSAKITERRRPSILEQQVAVHHSLLSARP